MHDLTILSNWQRVLESLRKAKTPRSKSRITDRPILEVFSVNIDEENGKKLRVVDTEKVSCSAVSSISLTSSTMLISTSLSWTKHLTSDTLPTKKIGNKSVEPMGLKLRKIVRCSASQKAYCAEIMSRVHICPIERRCCFMHNKTFS